MKNNLLVLCLIAVAAVLIGVGISVKITGDPMLVQMVGQQQEILALQKKIDRQMAGGKMGNSLSGQDLNGLLQKQKILEDRVTLLEKKLDGLTAMLQKGPQAPQPNRFAPPSEDFSKVYSIPVGKGSVRGKAGAPVTITGFLDLQCPFSARFQPVIDQAVAAFPGKVNYTIKHFPLSFHPQAKPAAKAVLAAGEQGKYFEMLELILKDNRDVSEAKLKEFAQSLKLNMKKYEADLKAKDAEWEKLIQADYELGTQVEVQGTPTYFINGRKTMARDLDSLKTEIEENLKKK